ncbi:hypothetical protein J437_LFUL010708 [Ladona fulva]|uniref:Protein msta n=1 Tax=Ladona fulva TaxID=123851 RepID=A0A8K0K5G0_LADFU|nr:hypothetical protein J437_LFUL010708 [Ladona fulva]
MSAEGQAGNCGVCGQPATLKCSGCKEQYYCSKEHQKSDWKRHKETCRPFKVCSSSELGRHVVAKRRIEQGEEILVESPIVFGPPYGRTPGPMCLSCGTPLPLMAVTSIATVRCQHCLWPSCGEDACMEGKKTAHTVECAILRLSRQRVIEALTGGQVTEELVQVAYESVTPLRCLLLQRIKPEHWRNLMSMEAHQGQPHSEDAPRVVRFLREILNLSKMDGTLMDEGKTGDVRRWDFSEAAINRVCAVLDVNALDIRLPGPSDGIALYANTCLLEHSCMPNTRHKFDDKLRIHLSSTRAILPGQHLHTMYTHILWGTQQRRDHLKVTKYFDCTCERCSDPTEMGTYISGLRCLACEKGYLLPDQPLEGVLAEWKCNNCAVSGEGIGVLGGEEVRSLVLGLGAEVEKTLEARPPSASSLEDLLSKLETLLHPHHSHCLAVKHSLLQILGKTGKMEEQQRKEAMCRDILGVYRALDPTLSRLGVYAAVAKYELHSVLVDVWRKKWEDGNSDDEARSKIVEARKCLQNAINLLSEENENLPEGRLLDVAKSSLEDLNRWAKLDE